MMQELQGVSREESSFLAVQGEACMVFPTPSLTRLGRRSTAKPGSSLSKVGRRVGFEMPGPAFWSPQQLRFSTELLSPRLVRAAEVSAAPGVSSVLDCREAHMLRSRFLSSFGSTAQKSLLSQPSGTPQTT